MKNIPQLKDDFESLLPAKIKLVQDVKAQYSNHKPGDGKTSWNTLDIILPKGSEFTISEKNQYGGEIYQTSKTQNGYPIDVFLRELTGKGIIAESNNEEKALNGKSKSGETKVLVQTAVFSGFVAIAFGLICYKMTNSRMGTIAGLGGGAVVGFVLGAYTQKVIKAKENSKKIQN